MKKKRESGKNFQNYKADNDGVTVYHRGENDAYHNLGCRGGQYAGHLKKCYMNGYKEGQARGMFHHIRPKEVGFYIISIKPH